MANHEHNIPEQVKLNTMRLDSIERTIFDKDNGLTCLVKSHDKDIEFFKRFLKFVAWAIGIVSCILITLFAVLLKYNLDLISQIASLTAKVLTIIGTAGGV